MKVNLRKCGKRSFQRHICAERARVKRMEGLTVMYSLSTLPYFAKNPNGRFSMERFELYTAAISSLVRRRAGNTTIMHCDTGGAEYFCKMGLSDLWNEMVITIPTDLDGINPKMFWAAGKLFALRETDCPVLMLDTDFIAWQLPELPGMSEASCIVAAHREPLSPRNYPDISHFKTTPDYSFDTALNFTVQPLNTAFLYMNDNEFKQYYIGCSMEFMKSALPCDDYLTYMVYAEQRLLAVLAEHKGIKVKAILEYNQLSLPQKRYTHTWGAKQFMQNNPTELERFCKKCRNRIRNDFPEWEHIIERIEKKR
ncbi:MAG: hypothetical protein FWH07_00495 [Oscillospiraceae bacterium]|nr:hypothetical protein [Oscillospiraceae bacterium]